MSKVNKKASQVVFEMLLKMIQNREFSNGDTLPSERELMKNYSVSRGAVREALQDLSAMGVVKIKHGERTKVSTPDIDKILGKLAYTTKHMLACSPQSLEELQNARVIFETSIVREATRLANEKEIEILEDILQKQIDSIENGSRFLDLDLEFHSKIVSIINNKLLTTITNAIFSWLRDYKTQLVSAHGVEELTIKEHRCILDAIKSKDQNRAEKAIKKHLLRLDEKYTTHSFKSKNKLLD